jgi:hypothetical protein
MPQPHGAASRLGTFLSVPSSSLLQQLSNWLCCLLNIRWNQCTIPQLLAGSRSVTLPIAFS